MTKDLFGRPAHTESDGARASDQVCVSGARIPPRRDPQRVESAARDGTFERRRRREPLRVENPRSGRYQVEPGFWHGGIVVPTPGAPILQIRPGAAGQVILSWPVHVTGFVLEETADLANPGGWAPSAGFAQDTPTEHTVIVPAVNIIRCYRLRRN